MIRIVHEQMSRWGLYIQIENITWKYGKIGSKTGEIFNAGYPGTEELSLLINVTGGRKSTEGLILIFFDSNKTFF
jgi:hypothetical protein